MLLSNMVIYAMDAALEIGEVFFNGIRGNGYSLFTTQVLASSIVSWISRLVTSLPLRQFDLRTPGIRQKHSIGSRGSLRERPVQLGSLCL